MTLPPMARQCQRLPEGWLVRRHDGEHYPRDDAGAYACRAPPQWRILYFLQISPATPLNLFFVAPPLAIYSLERPAAD
jgi:hypothetical protein